MLRAEQLALIQEANQQLLAIRAAEMDYYVAAFSSFGTQASLIAGFTLGTLTGLDVASYSVSEVWRAVFWISTSISMAASIHCVLTTTFANIYGPNLALRGPSGSMVRAVKGMIAEKSAIFVSFIIALVAFQCMTLATTWVVMKFYGACVCTVLLIGGGVYWYKYCLRIYNRFKFIEPDIEWRNSDMENSNLATTASYNSKEPKRAPAVNTDSSFEGSHNSDDRGGDSVSSSQRSQTSSFMSFMWRSKGKDQRTDGSHIPSATERALQAAAAPVEMQGYMSEGVSSRKGSKVEWARRYFVLKGCRMLSYRRREDFEADASNSIRSRPLDLFGLVLL